MKKSWGRQFFATGIDPPCLCEILTRCTSTRGFAVSTTTPAYGATLIEGKQTAGWHRVLLLALPQQLLWEVSHDSNNAKTVVRFDRWCFNWYRLFVTAFACITGYFWAAGVSSILRSIDSPGHISASTLMLPCVAGFFMCVLVRLIVSEGAALGRGLLEDVRSEVRKYGSSLDEKFGMRRDRILLSHSLLLAHVVVMTVLGVWLANVRLPTDIHTMSSAQRALAIAMVALLVMVAAGLTALVLAVRKRGMDERFAGIAPGLHSQMAIMLLLAGQISFYLIGATDHEFWELLFRARRLLDNGGGPVVLPSGEVFPRAAAEHGLSQARLVAGLLLGMTGTLWALSVAFLFRSVTCADQMIRVCTRLQSEIETKIARAAASGYAFLGAFRFTFATVWLLSTLMISSGVLSLLSIGLQALHGPSSGNEPSQPVGIVTGTAHMAEFLLGLNAYSPSVLLLSALLWAGWPLLMCSLFAVSLGNLLLRRLRTAAQLKGRIDRTSCTRDGTVLWGLALRLAERAGCAPPAIVVTPGDHPHASAHAYGPCATTRFVELSERTIDILDTAEVEALIAHEFAHHICGHCRKHNLLQVLGRLTLVGDGFVGTLEDSFGNELEADRTAVTRLCIKPEVLRECLAKMHVDAVLQHSRASESVGGLALHAVGAQEPPAWALTVAAPSGLVASLKRRCAAWLMLYTSEAEIAYWHPATDERIAALR